jgi:hypothetical protein
MMNVRVSEKVVKHIVKRHRDWVEMLGLSSEEVGDFIVRVLSQPDEVYEDRARGDVKYFLRRLDDKFICVVVVSDEVVTAYLINLEKYVKYRVRRWRLIGDGRGVSA